MLFGKLHDSAFQDVRIDVADRRDADAGHFGERVEVRAATAVDSDHSDPDIAIGAEDFRVRKSEGGSEAGHSLDEGATRGVGVVHRTTDREFRRR